ncbi:unnamed protein product [Rhizoctonia solani]|uniref:Uncharacterized protein n=1 Tax=Rhizoctonia solani TaxID=456999 RepID=A0A8H3HAB0_9AGAM|nr:unnamed protein product [Rhizoctonia solani]
MSSYPADGVCSPPELPPYLKNVHDLKPIRGAPGNAEVMRIHSVIQVVQKMIDIPGMGNRGLLARLSQHLFDVRSSIVANIYAWHFPRELLIPL